METITQSFIKKEFIVCLNSDIEETIQQFPSSTDLINTSLTLSFLFLFGHQLHPTYGKAPDWKWPLRSELWACQLVLWLPWKQRRRADLGRHSKRSERLTRSKVSAERWNLIVHGKKF